jgi:3-hydroxyisobutyrate dehydrogenase
MRKDVRLATQLIAKLALDLPIARETVRIWSESAGSIGDGEDFNRIVELQLGRM